MDMDRFWQLIEQARVKAGAAADQAVRDYDNPDDDPDRDYWDFDDLDIDAELRAEFGGPDTANDDVPDLDKDRDADEHDDDDDEDDDDDDDDDEDDDEDDDDDDKEVVDPIAIALVEVLGELPAAEIAAFDNVFDVVRARADRDDLANAAVLIEHGFIGDDSFDDFRAGLVALGRTTFEAALDSPDSLAGHPLVREIAQANDPRWLGREDVVYAASYAYAKVTGEDEMSFFDFAEAFAEEHPPPGLAAAGPNGNAAAAHAGSGAAVADGGAASVTDDGDDWDITDEVETRRRLPRLSELFYERSMRNRSRAMEKLGLAD